MDDFNLADTELTLFVCAALFISFFMVSYLVDVNFHNEMNDVVSVQVKDAVQFYYPQPMVSENLSEFYVDLFKSQVSIELQGVQK